jgi:hypothetical protein
MAKGHCLLQANMNMSLLTKPARLQRAILCALLLEDIGIDPVTLYHVISTRKRTSKATL